MVAAAIMVALVAKPPEPTPGHPLVLPTEFAENRFVVCPVTVGGRRLKFFTDSAGGHLISDKAAKECGLKVEPIQGADKHGPQSMTTFPAFRRSAFIPSDGVPLFVFPDKDMKENVGDWDGMLGQQWFAGRVWTFDYAKKRLLWRAPGDMPKHDSAHEVKLGVRTDAQGKRANNFMTIQVAIDGEPVWFTLDTGATDILPASVLRKVGDGRPADRATSFLGESLYKKWHAKHPDWQVIEEESLTGMAMIQVPKVSVAGYTVGPVWFSVQHDSAFHEYMAQWTDKVTEGSIGGSFFKYFQMTVDWPHAIAVFERP